MSRSRRDRDEAFGGDDVDEDIEYGFRRARGDVSYEFRSSSSLRPAEMMEREVYYAVAAHLLRQTHILAAIIALLSLWVNLQGRVASVVDSIREKFSS